MMLVKGWPTRSSLRRVPWAQAQASPERVKPPPKETPLIVENLGHHSERAAWCFPGGVITAAPSKQGRAHTYCVCFPSIYMSLPLKSFPEILRKCERNVVSKCVIFSSNRMSAHFLKDPFQILLRFKLILNKLEYPYQNQEANLFC